MKGNDLIVMSVLGGKSTLGFWLEKLYGYGQLGRATKVVNDDAAKIWVHLLSVVVTVPSIYSLINRNFTYFQ